MRLIYGVIYDTFFNSRPALVLGRLSRMRDTSRRAEGGTLPPRTLGRRLFGFVRAGAFSLSFPINVASI